MSNTSTVIDDAVASSEDATFMSPLFSQFKEERSVNSTASSPEQSPKRQPSPPRGWQVFTIVPRSAALPLKETTLSHGWTQCKGEGISQSRRLSTLTAEVTKADHSLNQSPPLSNESAGLSVVSDSLEYECSQNTTSALHTILRPTTSEQRKTPHRMLVLAEESVMAIEHQRGVSLQVNVDEPSLCRASRQPLALAQSAGSGIALAPIIRMNDSYPSKASHRYQQRMDKPGEGRFEVQQCISVAATPLPLSPLKRRPSRRSFRHRPSTAPSGSHSLRNFLPTIHRPGSKHKHEASDDVLSDLWRPLSRKGMQKGPHAKYEATSPLHATHCRDEPLRSPRLIRQSRPFTASQVHYTYPPLITSGQPAVLQEQGRGSARGVPPLLGHQHDSKYSRYAYRPAHGRQLSEQSQDRLILPVSERAFRKLKTVVRRLLPSRNVAFKAKVVTKASESTSTHTYSVLDGARSSQEPEITDRVYAHAVHSNPSISRDECVLFAPSERTCASRCTGLPSGRSSKFSRIHGTQTRVRPAAAITPPRLDPATGKRTEERVALWECLPREEMQYVEGSTYSVGGMSSATWMSGSDIGTGTSSAATNDSFQMRPAHCGRTFPTRIPLASSSPLVSRDQLRRMQPIKLVKTARSSVIFE